MLRRLISTLLVVALPVIQANANLCALHLMSPKIVLISGTDRPGSNTLKIAKQVEAMMKAQGHDVTLIDAAEMDTTGFKGQYFKTSADFKEKFTNKINAADGVIFVFPEYYGDIPGSLKSLIDYLAPINTFTDKPIAMITDADGMQGGIRGADTLAGIMRHRGANVGGKSIVYLPGISEKMKDDKIEDAGSLKRIESAVNDLIKKASEKFRAQLQIKQTLEFAMALKKSVHIELSSGAYVSGFMVDIQKDQRGFISALTLHNHVAITDGGKPISYQLLARQTNGLFVPVGQIKTAKGVKSLSDYGSITKLEEIGLKMHEAVTITYVSGIEVKGTLSNAFFSNGRLQVLTLNDAAVSQNGKELPEHTTDLLDLVIGDNILNVMAQQ